MSLRGEMTKPNITQCYATAGKLLHASHNCVLLLFTLSPCAVSSGVTTGPADPASGGGRRHPGGGGKIGLKYGKFFCKLN